MTADQDGPGVAGHRLVRGDPERALLCWTAVRAAQGRRPSASASVEAAGQLAAALVVLATTTDGVSGYAAGRVDGEVLHLLAVEVLPAVRGAGVGAALANGLADLGHPLGARRVRAGAEGSAFWEALGLERDGDAWWGVLDPPERTVVLHSGGLRLGQLLKLAGLAETGAEAKTLLAGGTVRVGGEQETRRGRQLTVGDVVAVADQQVRVVAPD